MYRALVLGTGDYFRKNGFDKAVLGLSGGIDSALSLVVAAEALGPDRVLAQGLEGAAPGRADDAPHQRRRDHGPHRRDLAPHPGSVLGNPPDLEVVS